MSRYAAYFDRRENNIEGYFTVMDRVTGTHVPGLKRLKVRSGQRRAVNTDWKRSASPIPYGSWWLDLSRPPKQEGQMDAGRSGIGEFWPIFSDFSDRDRISHPVDKSLYRTFIGIHRENEFEGSLGCPVVVDRDEFERLSKFLHLLRKDGVEEIPFIVL